MDLKLFDYTLPVQLIAQHPARPRDSSRLLVVQKNSVHRRFSDIVDYLLPGDVLVLNETKVAAAKLVGKKVSGSAAEVVLTKKINAVTYTCHVKTKNPHVGTEIKFKKGIGTIVGQQSIDEFVIRFEHTQVLQDAVLPTPPYIRRSVSKEEYQTVYSKKTGSLAAPTAGLHFTTRLLRAIRKKGVQIVFITLHVSYGTFKKIDSAIEKYRMDPEWFEISPLAAKIINERKGRLFVVGTTTLKALESSSHNRRIIPQKGESRLFIYPPFTFHSGADALITNFHLPQSTLLLLTCAFGGRRRVLDAYRAAVQKRYRFYSLGDAMLLYANK